MGANQMSELTSKISRQFQVALGERMFERNNDTRGSDTFEDVIFSFGNSSTHLNLYPCDNVGMCANEAVFISISSELSRRNFKALRRDQFISLDRVVQKLVQQVLGSCAGINKHVLLITDHLDSEVLGPWMPVVNQMLQSGVKIEIVYLNSKGQTNLVDLGMFL
jgi:hypothetical protein